MRHLEVAVLAGPKKSVVILSARILGGETVTSHNTRSIGRNAFMHIIQKTLFHIFAKQRAAPNRGYVGITREIFRARAPGAANLRNRSMRMRASKTKDKSKNLRREIADGR